MVPKAWITGAFALALLAGLALSACTNRSATRPTPTSESSIMSEAIVTAYPAPATAIPATVAPPTIAPATATPIAPPGTESLVGPEWTVAYRGDLNADGRADVVAYKPATITPGATFKRPEYAAYIGAASEAVIVQADTTGRPQMLVMMNLAGIMFGKQLAVSFPPSSNATYNPVALMLLIGTAQPATVAVLPINSSGEPYTQAAGVRWNRSLGAYELISGGK
ncbi:MAG: hypothetical protein HXY39_03505 [Chloroflexi bacterium]|nr:hypothetical protein [Chloroflexota bacterium]